MRQSSYLIPYFNNYLSTSFQPNAAGRAYEELYKTTWRTHVVRTVHGDASFSIRGFKGDYKVSVRHHGQEIVSESITLGDEAKNVHIDVGE